MATSRQEDGFKAWARVSDGNPCAFCSMLVSRGPVYSVDFEAHDGCGCSVMPVPRGVPGGGWTSGARAAREDWESAGGTLEGYRHLIYDRRKADGLALAA